MMSLRVCAVLVASLLSSPLVPQALAAEPTAAAAREEPRWHLDLATLRKAEIVSAHACGALLLVEDGKHGVTALDPASGAVVWFVQLDDALDQAPLAAGGRVVLSTPGAAVSLQLAKGRRDGRLPQLAPSAAAPVSDGDIVYLTSLAGDAVVARSLDTGLAHWSFDMPRQVTDLAWLDIAGSRSLLVVDASGTLRAIPAGAEVPRHVLWSTRAAGLVGTPIVVDRWVVAATGDQIVIAVDGGSGKRRWRFTGAHALTSAPVVSDGVVVVGRDGGLLGLSFEDGSVLWDLDRAGVPLGGLDGGRVLVEFDRGQAVLDVRSGAVVERVEGSALAVGGRLVSWDAQGLSGW